jgi:hypothetical protein
MVVRPVEDLRVESRRLPKIPFELFLILVIAVVLLGVFVVSTGSKRGDAESGRADAEARVAVAESSAREMAAVNVDLIEQNSELELQVESLEQDLQTALEGREAAELELANIPEVEPVDTSGLEAEIASLTDENVNLLEQLETVELQLADAPTISVAFAQYIGEQLSNSSLDVAQAQCFGSYVIERVGLDGLGVGLNSDRTSDANDAVTTAMSEGAAECDIDPGLVFGQ